MFALADSLDLPLTFQGPVAPRDNGDMAPLTIQPRAATWQHIQAVQRARRAASPEPGAVTASCEDGDGEEPATCGVGSNGVDIDPYGNVQACMHLQDSAGSLHEQSIAAIWHGSPVFRRARERSVAAARRFGDEAPSQYGAPVFCIAVEENAGNGHTGCGSCAEPCR